MTHVADVVGGADTVSGQDTVTLGQTLAAAREARGLAIDEVASRLRLGKHRVAALEEDRIGLIVAPVFVKGYLRQLAPLYGLKYEDLLARFDRDKRLAVAPVQTVPGIENLRTGRRVLRIGVWIVLIVFSGYLITRMAGDSIMQYVEPGWDALHSAVERMLSDAGEPGS